MSNDINNSKVTASTSAILKMNTLSQDIKSQLSLETDSKIDLYIRVKGKRKETFVVGFSKPITSDDTKMLLKKFRTKFACIAAFSDDDQYGSNVLKLSGDVRQELVRYLVEKFNYIENNIIIHG